MEQKAKEPQSLPKKIIEALDREVRNQLELASAISHHGESGRARENVIAAFLRKLVPQSFGIDTGFVIDSQGQVSRQVDIVIYRTDYHPVFEIGEVKLFLVESVIAVIENKARVTSEEDLYTALQNIASVKKLDRTNQSKNKIVGADTTNKPIMVDEFKHQVFGAIVTQESMLEKTLVEKLNDFLKGHARREWLNLYVDVNSFSVCYRRKRKTDDEVASLEHYELTANPSEAEDLFVSKPKESCAPPLADLAQELVNFLRVAPLVDFLPTSYLWKESKGQSYPLDATG